MKKFQHPSVSPSKHASMYNSKLRVSIELALVTTVFAFGKLWSNNIT